MHNRLRIIIALVIGIAHPLTLANFLPMKGRWVGEQGWPVLGACILTEELRFLILYHSQQPPFWPPARRVKGRKIRRKRPPHPHLPLKPAEEEELEQPPEGWPKSPHELLDREACVALFERVRWAQGVVCPRCGSWAIRQIPPRTQAGLQCYHCLACQSLFHAATGTLFEHSPLSPTQWMVALLSFAQADSALERADQLAASRRIGERWQRLFQVILYQQRPQEPLTGEVEVDELYHISGYKGHPNGLNPPRPPRRRRLKRRGRGELGEGQASHCGAGEAGRSHSPAGADQPAKGPMRPWLSTQIERGSRVYTDDYDIYDFLSQAGYGHRSVDHAAGE